MPHAVHAARLELRNYPTALLRLKTPLLRQMDAKDAKAGPGRPELYLDMGAVDVWRGREARLPLWNDFREVRGYKSWLRVCWGSLVCWLSFKHICVCVVHIAEGQGTVQGCW